MLSSRACPPGVEEVGGEGRCHVWSVVPQAQGYPTVSTLQRITNSTLMTYAHSSFIQFFAPHILFFDFFLDSKS